MSASTDATAAELEILRFEPAYRDHFRRLNLAWLERYFQVEPIDERVLGNPEAEILAQGGEILFARCGESIVGTVALKRESAASFELTKMAVDERWQGRGFGHRLLDSACQLAAERGATQVVLFSHTSLQAALSLYFKNGFVELPLDDSRYSRSNIKMIRSLR